jgi:hypothetical protein
LLVVNRPEGGTAALYGPLLKSIVFAVFSFKRKNHFVATDFATGKADVLVAAAIKGVCDADERNQEFEGAALRGGEY